MEVNSIQSDVLYNCIKGVLLGPNQALINGEEVFVAFKGFVSWDIEYNKEYFFEIEKSNKPYLTIIDLVKIS